MSYRPPTTSKYAPVSDPVPPSPFEQKRATMGARTLDRQSVDWKAFGGNKKEAGTMTAAAPVKTFTPIQPRNQLATYIDLAAPSIGKEEEKWQQSAIRRRPIPAPPSIPANKSYEDLFPTLGVARNTSRPTSPVIKPSQPAAAPLSMAERMRLKLAEEEKERQRQQEQSERERLAREEEERQGRSFGFVRSVNLSKKRQIFEDDDEPLEEGDGLETDVYGFRVGNSDSYLPSEMEEEPAEEDEAW